MPSAKKTQRIKVTAVAVVECGVCGREKKAAGTPGAVRCGRDRETSEGRESCSAYVMKEG